MTEAQERWEFEQAMRRFKVPTIKRHDGEYLHPDARIGWYVWMIRANLKPPTPVEKPTESKSLLGSPSFLKQDPPPWED